MGGGVSGDGVLEERFRRLFDESPLGKAVVDCNLRIVDANEALARFLGHGRDVLIGRSIADITHPDDAHADVTLATELLAGRIDHYQLDKRFVRADGSVMIGRLTASILREGDELYGIGVVEDVTARVRAEQQLAERDERLRMALEAAAMVVWEMDLRDGTIRLSENAEEAMGGGLVGFDGSFASFAAMVHPADITFADIDEIRAWLRGRDVFAGDFRLTGGAGGLRWIHARARVLHDGDGTPVRLVGTAMDVTAQRAAENARLESEVIFRRTIDASPDAFVGTDEHGRITDWNAAAESVFGWRAEEVLGRQMADIIVPEELRSLHRGAFDRSLHDGGAPRSQREVVAVHRDGRRFPVEVSMVAVESAMGHRFEGFVRDISERKAIEEQLTRQALTDPLTGLPNRVLLRDRLVHAITRLGRVDDHLSVLFLDLDRFKFVNDSVGHAEGDELLRVVADRLRGLVRDSDTVARFGGDEFVVLLESVAARDNVLELAQRTLDALSRPLVIAGHEIRPTASLGVAVTSDPAASPDDLIRDADTAMYRAKDRGGNCWELFDPVMRRSALARLEMETKLRQAIEEEQLELYYQPLIGQGGEVSGLEALVRWQHPVRGLVQPADFIPIAEETGLIVPLGAWVLRRACLDVARWRRTLSPGLHVSVNVSSRQLADPGIIGTVMKALSDAGLDPEALDLELTESALMEDAAAATSTLNALHELGVRIVVDDFGTGYSSLLYLRRFPVSVLKLDRYFVAGLGRHAEDDAIVGSASHLAHSLGLKAVAEGVETESQMSILRDLGCDFFQGFYWSPPVPAGDVEVMLTDGFAPRPTSSASSVAVAAPTVPVSTTGAPRPVVVVDDSDATRALLRAVLRRAGDFEVVGEAQDGHAAVGVVAACRPDLVLLDLAMPGRDGLDALAELLDVVPGTRVVVLSGFTSDGISDAVISAGAVACIDKSISAEGLLDALRSAATATVAVGAAPHSSLSAS